MATQFARSSSIFLLSLCVAASAGAQTCQQYHNCPKQQATPERHIQFEERSQERESERRRPESEPEERPAHRSRNVAADEPESQTIGRNHENTMVTRPDVVSPALRRAMTYNTRPGGIHINPEYFASHYGHDNGFHFTRYAGGPCVGDCGFTVLRGEWYFNFNGGWFGIMGPMPDNWGFQADYLYIDIGDDGNYYLHDAQFPDLMVQLTFVENIGDDQAGAEEDSDN